MVLRWSFFGGVAVSQCDSRLDNGSDQSGASFRKFFFLVYSELRMSKLRHIQIPHNVKNPVHIVASQPHKV